MFGDRGGRRRGFTARGGGFGRRAAAQPQFLPHFRAIRRAYLVDSGQIADFAVGDPCNVVQRIAPFDGVGLAGVAALRQFVVVAVVGVLPEHPANNSPNVRHTAMRRHPAHLLPVLKSSPQSSFRF